MRCAPVGRVFGVSMTAFMTFTVPAFADKIDGEWCKPNSTDRMIIDGSRVVTPEGTEVVGRYTRHTVEYDVPAGEHPVGGRIHAEQLDEDRIDVARIRKVQQEPPAHDIWRRCQDVS